MLHTLASKFRHGPHCTYCLMEDTGNYTWICKCGKCYDRGGTDPGCWWEHIKGYVIQLSLGGHLGSLPGREI